MRPDIEAGQQVMKVADADRDQRNARERSVRMIDPTAQRDDHRSIVKHFRRDRRADDHAAVGIVLLCLEVVTIGVVPDTRHLMTRVEHDIAVLVEHQDRTEISRTQCLIEQECVALGSGHCHGLGIFSALDHRLQ